MKQHREVFDKKRLEKSCLPACIYACIPACPSRIVHDKLCITNCQSRYLSITTCPSLPLGFGYLPLSPFNTRLLLIYFSVKMDELVTHPTLALPECKPCFDMYNLGTFTIKGASLSIVCTVVDTLFFSLCLSLSLDALYAIVRS